MDQPSADYVIIGSGSAGSTLAYRLSENGKYSVLVLEYGGSDAGPFIQMPGALSYPMNMKRYDWEFKTQAEPHLNGRSLVVPRGKVIGGSSSINGMVYVRGHAEDYNHWQASGAKGWSYQDVLPFFKKMEHWHGGAETAEHKAWRGFNGPLHVTRGKRDNPLHAAFVKAGLAAGFNPTEDYNGKVQEGFGSMEMTVWKGQRWSTANAYLKPALKRKNCQILRCFVHKIIIENKKAIGVEVIAKGKSFMVKARKEVILSASSINSPKILMLSGIGDADHLKDKGIEVVVDLKGVGKNLQDHLELYIQQACTQPITLYKYWNLWGKAWVGLEWLLTKGGIGASNQFESAAFVRSDPSMSYPDIQYHFLPIAVRYDGKAASEGHGFQAHVGPMRSPSRGEVRLASDKPYDAPLIQFNYMAHEEDWAKFRHCIRLTRKIFGQSVFDEYRGKEIQPGADITSDADLNEFIMNHVESAYHPCGTVKMGAKEDMMACIDSECRIFGIEGLRVVDSSIFPRITYGNLNAPSIMVAEKAAEMILTSA